MSVITSHPLIGQPCPAKKNPIPQIKIPDHEAIKRICKEFKAQPPWVAKSPERYGFTLADKKADRWRKLLWHTKRQITSVEGLSATQRAVLAVYTHFAPILLNEAGAFFRGPSSVALSVLVKAARKSPASAKQARAELVERGLMAPVRRSKFDGNKTKTEFVVNHPKLRTLGHQWEDPTLDAQIEAALKEWDKHDPFRDMHDKAKPLYLALVKNPKLTNAKLTKKLGVSPATLKRIKSEFVAVGAMHPAKAVGFAPTINPSFFQPTKHEVIEDFNPIEAEEMERGEGGQSPDRSDQIKSELVHSEGGSKGAQSPARNWPLRYIKGELPENAGLANDPKVESQPEDGGQKTDFSNDPEQRSKQSQAEVEETDRELFDLDGSAAGPLTWDEYKARFAVRGRSLFALRAMAAKAGVDLPPLNLADGSTHDAVSKLEPVAPSITAHAQRYDDGTPEEQEAWRAFRTLHWNAGVRPVAAIRDMAREAGLYVPPFREPRKTPSPRVEPFSEPTMQSWGTCTGHV